jgi:hypothetical protein
MTDYVKLPAVRPRFGRCPMRYDNPTIARGNFS